MRLMLTMQCNRGPMCTGRTLVNMAERELKLDWVGSQAHTGVLHLSCPGDLRGCGAPAEVQMAPKAQKKRKDDTAPHTALECAPERPLYLSASKTRFFGCSAACLSGAPLTKQRLRSHVHRRSGDSVSVMRLPKRKPWRKRG